MELFSISIPGGSLDTVSIMYVSLVGLQKKKVKEKAKGYDGGSTVMNFGTSYYTLIIQWCSRWRYIMTSPVMPRIVTSFKD